MCPWGHNRSMRVDGNAPVLSAGDKVVVGREVVVVDEAFAASLQPGDLVLGVGSTGSLKRLPADIVALVDDAVARATRAFSALSAVDPSRVDAFFEIAAERLGNDGVFGPVRAANDADVEAARARGRSTTRLVLSDGMRADMISAMRMWRDLPSGASQRLSDVRHDGWSVEEWTAPLGVIGFVFEGRPNVFADATGVLKGGNSVVFRIGSDALGTAVALMDAVIRPALEQSGLPDGSAVLVEAAEHAAGWALFSDRRIALAVARGSGPAVAELGSIAQQSGVPVSLHGTGGAWILAGVSAPHDRFSAVVEHSLDRKVCNTANVVCVPESVADQLVPLVWQASHRAAARRGTRPRIHAVNGAERFLSGAGDADDEMDVVRAGGVVRERQVTPGSVDDLGVEFEWEESPEFHLVLVDSMDEAVSLFNTHSPQFIASVVSSDPAEIDTVWKAVNAPFFGDGFTRWVDGQFALKRPELGLSNWQAGRLFARGGILSGDSAYTVRLRVRQENPGLHR